MTTAGCGSRAGAPHGSIETEITNVARDLSGVRDDLLVARIDADGQRSRLRLARDDMRIVRQSSAGLVCEAAEDVASDARSARDGVVALHNDVGRVQGSLTIVELDLAGIERQLRTTGVPAGNAIRLEDTRAQALRLIRRYGAQIGFLMTQANRLQKRTALIADQAAELCRRNPKTRAIS